LQDTLANQFQRDRELFGTNSAILSQARLVSAVTSNFEDLSCANTKLTSLVSAASVADSTLSKAFADHNAHSVFDRGHCLAAVGQRIAVIVGYHATVAYVTKFTVSIAQA
jgi:hypothetical protein